MLLRCGLSNYLSICERQDISTIASALRNDLDHVRPIAAAGLEKQGYLPVLALYGANAAGKSNTLRAVGAIFDAVKYSYRRSVSKQDGGLEPLPYRPPHFAKTMRDQASHFDVDVVLDNVRYHYGFETNASGVLAEWLHAYPKGSKTVLFERDFSGNVTPAVKFGRSMGTPDATITDLATNRSFLFFSAVQSVGQTPLKALSEKFTSSVRFVKDDSRFSESVVAELLQKDEQVREQLRKFISLADFGILGIDVVTRPTPESLKKLIAGMRELFVSVYRSDVGDAFNPDDPDTELKLQFTHSGHDGETFVLGIENESSGTLSLLSLLVPALSALENGQTLIVDELNNTLHTKLSEILVRLFASKEVNSKGAQFIFSTHDTKLLDPTVFRRDEIWFAAKDIAGKTTIYPLTDFSTRKTDNLERSYLEGRYGAIPYFGNIAALFAGAQ